MDESELLRRNLGLAFGLLRSIAADESVATSLPDLREEALVLFDADDAEQRHATSQLAKRLRDRGTNVVELTLRRTVSVVSR